VTTNVVTYDSINCSLNLSEGHIFKNLCSSVYMTYECNYYIFEIFPGFRKLEIRQNFQNRELPCFMRHKLRNSQYIYRTYA